ncbi:MAG: transporter [Shimia sp.]
MLFAGATWRQEAALTFSVTFQARYETFGRQETINIRPGDVLSLEFAPGKQINEEWALGVLAATSFQVSGQSNTPGGNPPKYRINLVGFEAVWRPEAFRGAQVALRLRKEFENRNTAQGQSARLSLAYAF